MWSSIRGEKLLIVLASTGLVGGPCSLLIPPDPGGNIPPPRAVVVAVLAGLDIAIVLVYIVIIVIVGAVIAGGESNRVENLVQGGTVVHYRASHVLAEAVIPLLGERKMQVIDHTNRWQPSNYRTPIRLNIDMN
ncbi:hypothetical protein QBC37DRAFT_400818 [Rhypophila decipiens]|uniref:Uncharacterized protein n=1 Tax=Rhypophila decipiens TaxID=261697 RepID=A0AAN7B7J6_9PEZI|nr:hypothetical protein QBC37DRAFT_400818 [Rhypophila decipiens]